MRRGSGILSRLQLREVEGKATESHKLRCAGAESAYFSDDEEGWINMENVDDCLARDGSKVACAPEDDARVGCVANDFAMLNVLLQMGVKLISVDGRRTIKQIGRYSLRCQACATLRMQLEQQFCDRCGNTAMHRIVLNVNK